MQVIKSSSHQVVRSLRGTLMGEGERGACACARTCSAPLGEREAGWVGATQVCTGAAAWVRIPSPSTCIGLAPVPLRQQHPSPAATPTPRQPRQASHSTARSDRRNRARRPPCRRQQGSRQRGMRRALRRRRASAARTCRCRLPAPAATSDVTQPTPTLRL